MIDGEIDEIPRLCRRIRYAFLVQKIFVNRKLFNFPGVSFWFFATPVSNLNSFRRFHYVTPAVSETEQPKGYNDPERQRRRKMASHGNTDPLKLRLRCHPGRRN